jgi:hypothetical protein
LTVILENEFADTQLARNRNAAKLHPERARCPVWGGDVDVDSGEIDLGSEWLGVLPAMFMKSTNF